MELEETSILSNVISHDHVQCMLEEIFAACITETDTSELINNLSDVYDSFNGQGFENGFDQILLYVLSEGKRGSDATKILRFISESIVSLDNKYKAAAKKDGVIEDIDDIVHPLLKRLFKILYSCSQSSSYIVRFRSCQLLYMIFTFIQDHGMGEIDMVTFENVANIIEARKLDVSSLVRTHAVLLAKFFQDPSAISDPVIESLCWQMQYDPNSRVRQNIVSIIAACEETVTPICKRFLYDKNPVVRNTALLHICQRIGPRSFTPTQRVLILQQCFTDPSDVIRQTAEQKLIPVWFRACGDKLCSFFKLLRIRNDSLDNLPFIKELSKILSRFVKISQILEEIEIDTSGTCLPRLPLSGEKVFLWRHFFKYSNTDERLAKFFPQLDQLIPFILKCFDDSSSEEVEECVFAELILFLKDIMGAMGIKQCEEVFPMSLNLMRHPFVSYELMPYLVSLYVTYSPKEKEYIHNDILEVVQDLQKLMLLTQGQELNILLKCFVIASQLLREEEFLTTSMKNIKDDLIVHHLSSDNLEVKIHAISALTQYCLLDLKETKLSWSFYENAIHMESSNIRNVLLEGAFDILKCHGKSIFADITDDGQGKLEAILESMLDILEDGQAEQEIILRGILKLYSERHISSSTLLANLVLLSFQPSDYALVQKDLDHFFSIFGSSKDGYNCLVEAYLAAIDILFSANKNSSMYKINIKTAAVQLLEMTKTNKNLYNNGENFQDLLVLELTKKFLKKPWRITPSDLHSICSHVIPEKFDTLMTLKDHVTQIVESLQSSIFQQKNPFAKKNIKNFIAYQKKIQTAMNSTLTKELSSKRESRLSVSKKLEFNSSSSSSILENTSFKENDLQIDNCPSPESSNGKLDTSLPVDSSSEKSLSARSLDTPTPSKKVRSTRKKAPAVTTTEVQTPEFMKTRKIATPSQKKTLHRNSSLLTRVEEDENSVFKTPAPRKTPSRKRQLNISIAKT